MDTRPLKIFHMLLSRGFAGSERSTAESCNRQCEEHEVTVIIRRGHRRHGVSIVDHLDPQVKIIEISHRFFTGWTLRRIIKREQPDIIHAHLRRSTRIVARLALARTATVSTLHIGVNGPHFSKMDGIVCNARWQLEDVPKDYRGEVFKANNSVVPHRQLPPGEIQQLRQDLDVDGQQYLIGAVGRYHPSKAWDTLIRAFKAVNSPAAQLLFFGSGSQESELKSLAEGDSRIRFIGYRQDIKDLYQTFDLCVCPSRFEPLPRVILEAMDAGTPVLASDAGGCKELIEDYGGLMFPVDDSDALAAALARAIDERPGRHRPDLTAHYSEIANRDMVEFYRRLINRKLQATA